MALDGHACPKTRRLQGFCKLGMSLQGANGGVKAALHALWATASGTLFVLETITCHTL